MSNLKEKDQSTSITEAGFLMGLGLNGHLRELPETDLCNLLSQVCGVGPSPYTLAESECDKSFLSFSSEVACAQQDYYWECLLQGSSQSALITHIHQTSVHPVISIRLAYIQWYTSD